MRLASVALWALAAAAGVAALESDGGPAHRYAAPLHVECIDRNEYVSPRPSSPNSFLRAVARPPLLTHQANSFSQ